METMIIGIAGGTGSGKTTLTLRLKEHFGEDVSILYHDNYYKQHDDMPYEERCRLNYDHPDAFDTELLIADLQALRRGEAVHSPTYDYTVHNRAAETVEVRPARVILVEGILIFVDPALRELMDIKLFVDTEPPSSPCTSSLWSPLNATPTSLCRRAAKTRWPWT